jgi:hypothetical protein
MQAQASGGNRGPCQNILTIVSSAMGSKLLLRWQEFDGKEVARVDKVRTIIIRQEPMQRVNRQERRGRNNLTGASLFGRDAAQDAGMAPKDAPRHSPVEYRDCCFKGDSRPIPRRPPAVSSAGI